MTTVLLPVADFMINCSASLSNVFPHIYLVLSHFVCSLAAPPYSPRIHWQETSSTSSRYKRYITIIILQGLLTNMNSSFSKDEVVTQTIGQTSEIFSRIDRVEVIPRSDVEKSVQDEEITSPPNVPRADGGRHAWLFLAGCFVFEALIWGKICFASSSDPGSFTLILRTSRLSILFRGFSILLFYTSSIFGAPKRDCYHRQLLDWSHVSLCFYLAIRSRNLAHHPSEGFR